MTKAVTPGLILTMVKVIYGALRSWLWELAKKSDTPVDDWMLQLFDLLFGFVPQPKTFKMPDPGTVLLLFRTIYAALRSWLWEMAKKSDTPVDDWMLELLDTLLGFVQKV